MGLKWGIILLIPALMISSVSLLGRLARRLRFTKTDTRQTQFRGPERTGYPARSETSVNSLFLNAVLHENFRSKNYEFGTKTFSRSQTFLIHFSILEVRILWMIEPVNCNDRWLHAVTVQSRRLWSKTFSKSGLLGFFFFQISQMFYRFYISW